LGLLNETPTPPVQLHWNEIDPNVADVEFSSLPTKITLGPRAQIPGTVLIVTKDQAAQMRDGTVQCASSNLFLSPLAWIDRKNWQYRTLRVSIKYFSEYI
jgi:hypothetical protein